MPWQGWQGTVKEGELLYMPGVGQPSPAWEGFKGSWGFLGSGFKVYRVEGFGVLENSSGLGLGVV